MVIQKVEKGEFLNSDGVFNEYLASDQLNNVNYFGHGSSPYEAFMDLIDNMAEDVREI